MNDTCDSRPSLSGLHGRRKGKKLRSFHAQLMTHLLPELSVDTSRPFVVAETRAADATSDLWLEIGFGGGEHLAAQARAHPEIQFIGCEPFVNGVAKLLAEIDAAGLRNISVHADDATKFLDQLATGSVSRIYLLFPDPWPKRRHKKRRFFSETNLRALARVLKDGAELRFATDIDDYAGWALSRVLKSADFRWAAVHSGDWAEPWPDHHTTRYEQKGTAAGRKSVYLTFVRNG